MPKKVVSRVIFSILMISMLISLSKVQQVRTDPRTIIVPDNYPTIQAAINAASNGDTIFVKTGTYYENLIVNKTVVLVGENKSNTIIDGNLVGNVMEITASNVNVSCFTLENGICGIHVSLSDGNNLSNNIMTKNGYGIYIEGYSGWPFDPASNNIIASNEIFLNERGMMLLDCSNCMLTGNVLHDNELINFGLHGAFFADGYTGFYNNQIDTSNTVDGKPIYYLVGVSDEICDNTSNAGVVYAIGCNNLTIKDLTLRKSYYGILFYNTVNSQTNNVSISDNFYGIFLVNSHSNNFTNNNINRGKGVHLASSENNGFIRNIITNNGDGVELLTHSYYNVFADNNITSNTVGIDLYTQTAGNKISHNNFINNTYQVWSSVPGGVNIWDDGYPSGGNYWNDYVGTDLFKGPYQNEIGSDGIGDVPYVIDENNQDNYPLMQPWPFDAIPPDIVVLSPQNATYYSNSVPITLQINEQTSWIGYSLDNQPNVTISGNAIVDIGDGSHQIIIYANDTSGNMGSSEIIYFTVDSSLYDPWKTSFIGLGNYPIVDFAVYNGKLYAATDNKLYVYDGSSWNIIDAPAFVVSLESYEDKLIVGGQGGLYSFDGTTFNMILTVPTYIKVLGIYNNTLYAGTILDKPPILYYCNGSADNPADWHVETGFSSILNFSGPFGSIDSFAEYNGNLYVTSRGTVYCYNETGWSIVKTYDDVYAFLDMQVYDGELYLATRDQGWRKPIYQEGTGFGGRVIEFDGENWTTILDHDYWIYSLEVYDDKLFAGTANKIYTYNGTDWDVSFSALDGAYYAISMITYDGKIYVGMGNGYIFVDPVFEAAKTETPVVPEFPLVIMLPILMLTTLLGTIYTKKKSRKPQPLFRMCSDSGDL